MKFSKIRRFIIQILYTYEKHQMYIGEYSNTAPLKVPVQDSMQLLRIWWSHERCSCKSKNSFNWCIT